MNIKSTFLLSVLVAQSALAISDNAGTKNGAFLKLATDARGVALGPTMVSMAQGTEGMRWNPAALAIGEGHEAAATHIEYFQDVSIENVSFVHPLQDGTIGGNFFYLTAGDLDGRDANNVKTGDFAFYDAVLSVGYGRRVSSREDRGMDIYVGGALKAVQEKIADEQYRNVAADIGMVMDPIDNLRLGATARNLSTGKADFPKELTVGASYSTFKILTAGLAMRYSDDAPVRLGLSGECKVPEFENSVIRVGYMTHDELDNSTDAKISGLRQASLAGLSFGGGLEIRPPTLKTTHFIVDYTMAPFGALGIAHTVTVKVRW